jgi:DNA-binding transcriptional ArsR family regulator
LPKRRNRKAQAAPENPVRLFAALGDDARLRLVARLCDAGPMSIAGLTAGAGITRQAVTKHLRVMEGAGLVHCARRGRETVWRLDPLRLDGARRYLKRISRQWDDALEKLRRLVEE